MTGSPFLTRSAISAALLVLMFGALLPACSSDNSAAPSATSPERSTTTEDRRDPGNSTGGSDETSLPGIPDIPDLPEIPGAEELGDCAEVVLAYTQLAFTVLQGAEAQAEVNAVLAKVKSKVPAALQDDLKVVGDSYAKAAEAGLLNAGQVLDDPEFKKSNKAVGDYLKDECGAPLDGN